VGTVRGDVVLLLLELVENQNQGHSVRLDTNPAKCKLPYVSSLVSVHFHVVPYNYQDTEY
jgi:hypothetical protein